jgi:hypothetical protein
MDGTSPQTGIYAGIPFHEYVEWPYINGSTLAKAFVDGIPSAKHLLAAIEHRLKVPESKQIGFGRAGHARLLEPVFFSERFKVATPCAALIKSKTSYRCGLPCGNDPTYEFDGQFYCGVRGHAPEGAVPVGEVVTVEQAARLERMAKAVQQDPAIHLLRTQGGFEESFVAELDGVLCKGRCDKIITSPPQPYPAGDSRNFPRCVADIKFVSAKRHTDAIFFRQAIDLLYDAKAAFYLDGLKAIDGIERRFVWAVIEADDPFDISVKFAPHALIRSGRERYKQVLAMYQEGVTKGVWPGLYNDVHDLELPEWWCNANRDHFSQ